MTTATKNGTTTTPEGSVAASALRRAIVAVKPLAKPTYWTDKPSLPARIRLDWTDDALTVTATDGETWASYEIRTAICMSPGSAIIHAGLLAAVAKTSGQVAIGQSLPTPDEPEKIIFTTGAGTTKLRTIADPDWPQAPAVPTDNPWSIDPAHLRSVLPAASTEDSRPILCAVAFQPGAMVATDSYCLHYIDGGLPDYPNLLIPEHALRWVAKETESVSLSATGDER